LNNEFTKKNWDILERPAVLCEKKVHFVRRALLGVCQHLAVCGEGCTVLCKTKLKNNFRLQEGKDFTADIFKT